MVSFCICVLNRILPK